MGKKIAFVGCSFTEFKTLGSEERGWSFLLSQMYPQHEYRNYGYGGTGIQYHDFCIRDAIDWGADAIFLSTTYFGRYSYVTDHCGENTYTKIELPNSDNYSSFIYYSGDNIGHWTHISGGKVLAPSLGKTGIDAMYNTAGLQISSKLSTSETYYSYQYEFYRTAPKVYNVEKFWLLDFNPVYPHPKFLDKDWAGFKYHNPDWNVWEIMAGYKSYWNPDMLFARGMINAEDDNHFSPEGNQVVLHDYVLNDDVKKYLDSN